MARRLALLISLFTAVLTIQEPYRDSLDPSVQSFCDDKGSEENPPSPLPQRATSADLKWQPALDFDTDSCYNVPAIGPDGRISRGRSRNEADAEGCRDEMDLDNGNVYARQRCNANGWCAQVYDYFFEKDVGDRLCIGHRFDWEHMVVWTRHGVPRMAAASAHGRYDTRLWDDLAKHQETHVKAVYNKDGLIGTHYFRWSHGARDEPPENHKRQWWRSALVSWNGFPSVALRDKLAAHDFGAGHMAITDAALPENLRRSVEKIRDKVPDFDFDFNRDEAGSPGVPV